MGTVNIESKEKYYKEKGVGYRWPIAYSKGQLNKFNPKILGLRDIAQASEQVEAIAAVFDLGGFTNFCKQVDPHLCVPKYLNVFLNWLFDLIKDEFKNKKIGNDNLLYAELPFFAKFLGDGVLFLWKCRNLNMTSMCNVIVMLGRICNRYEREFIPRISKDFTEIPKHLRCGVARGMVFSIGNGEDYVGPCINIASRLQKLSRLTFCFSRRGFDFEEGMTEKTAQLYVVKSCEIRGIGNKELVCVRRAEFEKLPQKDKRYFSDI